MKPLTEENAGWNLAICVKGRKAKASSKLNHNVGLFFFLKHTNNEAPNKTIQTVQSHTGMGSAAKQRGKEEWHLFITSNKSKAYKEDQKIYRDEQIFIKNVPTPYKLYI